MRKALVYPTLIYFGIFLLAGLLYPLIDLLVEAVWAYLVYLFPDRLTLYNEITGGEGYRIYSRAVSLIKVLFTMLPASYLSARLDNARFEYLTGLTDGRYGIGRGLSLYLGKYAPSDAVIACFPPLLLTLPAGYIPRRLMNIGLDIPFWCGDALIPYYGAALCLPISLGLALLARLLAALLAVRYYRAAWLSGGN